MATDNNIQKPKTVGDILRAYQSGIAPQEDIEATQQEQQPVIPSYESQVRRDLSGGVSQTYTSEALQSGYGTSRFDTRYQPERDLEDSRAEAQSGFGKIANGVAKGGVTAVATAANTVAGLPYGLARGLFELATGLIGDDEKRNPVDAAVNNEVGQFTQRMQDLSEQLFPNYKTNEERSEEYQRKFIRHTLTPNFIGDDFIKNFGFTIGAVVGGSVMSRGVNKLLYRNLSNDIMKGAVVASSGDAEATAEMKRVAEAIKRGNLTRVEGETLVANMKDIGKRLNRANSYSQLIGAGIAAAGEGTFEGLNIRKEFLDEVRRDASDQLQEDYRKAYDDIIAENNPDYVIENGGIVEDATGRHNIPILNGDGQDELLKRQRELTAKYQKMLAYADTQAERLASLTFVLNLPILTASNTYQFGRMLSGGWKTARRSASLSGGLSKGITPSANYKPRGSVASRTIFKSLGLAGSEAMEEMSQGFVSSGLKKGAQMRLASFTNDGYNAEQIDKYASWLEGLGNGGMDYLSDVKNWKEGWLGALTGMLGIPGRTWNGGVVEARREAREEYDIDKRLAEKLNQTVNSEDFDSRLRGWVRHMKYDDDMSKAVQANDEYAWHTADDRQLISDIITFADADRLDDYLDIVESYKTVSVQEMDQLKGSLDWARNMSNEDVQEKINEQANKIENKVKEYKKIYEAMQARVPLGASKPYLNELVATAMEIKAYEQRFMNLFGEVFNMIDPVLKTMAERDSKDNKYSGQELEKRLSNIRNRYELRLNSLIPEEDLTQEANEERKLFDSLLDIAVGQKKQMREKLDDLRKLQDARALYYKKLQTLEGANGQQKYEEQAATPEIVQAAAEAEHMNETMQGFNSISDIKAAYFQKKVGKERQDFVDMLQRNHGNNTYAKEFVNMINTYNKLNRYVDTHKMNPESFPIENTVLPRVMSEVINNAQSENDILTLPDNMFPDVETFINRYSTVFVPMNDSTYDMMKRDLRAIVKQYAQGAAHTASKDKANPTPTPAPANPAVTETPEGYDASQPASAAPMPVAPGNPQPEPEHVEEPEPEQQQPAEQDSVTTVNNPAGSDTVDDAFFAGQAAETPQSEIIDSESQYSKKAYYRTSVPEIATGEAEKARDAIKTGLREDLKKADLSDFVDSHPQFADVWNALNNEGAFKAIALDVQLGDRIEFIIDPSFPLYEGKPQILMAKRKDDGTYQILTPLLTKTNMYQWLAELREDIKEEYDSFIEQHPGELFVFSKSTTVIVKRPGLIEYDFNKDADKPIKDIRAYDDIKQVAQYVFVDGNAELRLVGDESGEGADIPKKLKEFFDNKINDEKNSMRGNFYLIVPSGDAYAQKDSSYIPIRLGFEHFKKGNIDNNEYLIGIRDTVRELEDIIRATTADNIEDEKEYVQKTDDDGKPIFKGVTDEEGNPVIEEYEYTDEKTGEARKDQRQVQEPVMEEVTKKKGQNTLMREKLKKLGDVLDIHRLYFELGVYENVGPAVRIIQDRLSEEQKKKMIEAGEAVPEEKELTMRRPEQVRQDFLTELFADLNGGKGLSVQVRFENKGKGRTYVSTKIFNNMIDARVITSNAKMLRPKGVDFYTLPYSKRSHDFFEATPWQTVAMESIRNGRAFESASNMDIGQAFNKPEAAPASEQVRKGRKRRMVPLDNYPTYASESEAGLRDGLVQKMRDSGIDVITDEENASSAIKNSVKMLRESQNLLSLYNNSNDTTNNGANGESKENKHFPEILGQHREGQAANRTIQQAATISRRVRRRAEEQEGFPKEYFLAALEVAARKDNTWIDDMSSVGTRMSGQSGKESEIYLSKDGRKVIKLNRFTMLDSKHGIEEFIDRINSHNEFASNVPYQVLGFAENTDGEVCIVLEQPHVKGYEAEQSDIDNFLWDSGFSKTKLSDVYSGWTNGIYEIWDAEPKNVLKDDEGNLYFIDTVVNNIQRIIQNKTNGSKFFKTDDGDVYGFVNNGKVYIDTSKVTADTPIHEYTHLWAEAIRKNNPSEWNNIRSIMEEETELWKKVQAKYPELHGDDLAEEVLAHYSGRRGAERLRAELSGSTDEGSVSRAFKVVTDALDRFWKAVADMLGIHFTKAEDIADAVLSDLINGVNPNDELSWTNDPTDSRFWVVRSENDLRRVIRGTSMTDSITPMVAYRYSELPEDIREMLDIHGYTDENYNHMPDLLKDRVLRCAGV